MHYILCNYYIPIIYVLLTLYVTKPQKYQEENNR